MDTLSLKANERTVLGKKVKQLRKNGELPGHVYGNTKEAESVSVSRKDFITVFQQAGETGLVNLKIGTEKTRPVLIRGIQHHPVTGEILNIDFYQVNLKEKVTVPVPIELVGDEPELVHMGEAMVLQNLSQVEVEALPADLIEKIEVNIEVLKEVDDAITVENLSYDRSTLTVLAEPDEVVVKLAPVVVEVEEEPAAEEGQEGEGAESAEGEAEEQSADGGEQTDADAEKPQE